VNRWLDRRGPAFWKSSRCGEGDEAGPKKSDLYRRYGAWPVGDTAHVAGGGWPASYHASRATERRWKENGERWWAGHFRGVAWEPRRIRGIVADRRTSLVKAFGDRPTGEQMIPLIESLAYGVSTSGETPPSASDGRFVVNIPNRSGFIPGIPGDVAVEIPAWADRRGIHGVRTSGLPPAILIHTLRDLVGTMEMELLAYDRGSRGYLRDLVALDPWTRSREQADRLLDRILAMPSNAAMRRHYRERGRMGT
jgi:alpha-galactosidase